MARCPVGHESAATDFCDTCGEPLGAPAGAPAPVPPVAVAPADESTSCPACGADTPGRFCEACGHDTALPPPQAAGPGTGAPPVLAAAPAGWVAELAVDADFFAEVRRRRGPDVAGLVLPTGVAPRAVVLDGDEASVGRSPAALLRPEPEDPGLSRRHAVLRARGEGWVVVDLGSTNGTFLAGSPDPLPTGEPTPVPDGAAVLVGAWTAIRLRRT